MKRDMSVYIEDILECITKIEEYTNDISESDFYKNSQVQDAVLRRLEVMGEAVKNVSPDLKDSYPDIPWKKIAGLRDVLIHKYFGVNLERAWQVIEKDIFKLKNQILQLKQDL